MDPLSRVRLELWLLLRRILIKVPWVWPRPPPQWVTVWGVLAETLPSPSFPAGMRAPSGGPVRCRLSPASGARLLGRGEGRIPSSCPSLSHPARGPVTVLGPEIQGKRLDSPPSSCCSNTGIWAACLLSGDVTSHQFAPRLLTPQWCLHPALGRLAVILLHF